MSHSICFSWISWHCWFFHFMVYELMCRVFEHLSAELTIYNRNTSTEFQHTEVIRIVIDVSKSHKVNGCVLSEKLRHFHFCLPSQRGLAVKEKNIPVVLEQTSLWNCFIALESHKNYYLWRNGKRLLDLWQKCADRCDIPSSWWKMKIRKFSLYFWHTMISVSCILFIYYVNVVSSCIWFVRCMLLNL